jgi:hypothetical protein
MSIAEIIFGIIIIAIIVYLYLIVQKNQKTVKSEGFCSGAYRRLRAGPFQPVPVTSNLVDPLVCYPGTYWRNGTYQDSCYKMSQLRPSRMDVEGNAVREPEKKYKMVCSVDDHLNRNCQMLKVYDRYY